jgi:hypothetical protein
MTDIECNSDEPNRTISFGPRALAAIEKLRSLGGWETIVDTLSSAIGHEMYFREKVKDGYVILIQRGSDTREVILQSGGAKS